MKKIYLLLLLLSNFSFAQTFTWATADSTYQGSYGALSNLAKDSFGNLYVAYAAIGYQNYANEIIVTKYDVSHVKIWTQKITTKGIFSGIGLCSDRLGNVY